MYHSYMPEKRNTSIRLFSYEDDRPNEERGSLIPGAKSGHMSKTDFTPVSVASSFKKPRIRAAISMVGLFALVVLGATGYGLAAQSNLAAAPIVTMTDPYTQDSIDLGYGPQISLANNNFFLETRDDFIDESMTFVEIDMTRQQLRFFKKGVLLQSAEIFGLGEEGSWWETPSGLYKVEKKDEQIFTNIGQAYLPWLITFQGNYLIHGLPTYPDGSVVDEDFKVGGVRLDDGAAEALYRNVRIGTPVLVHAAEESERDTFVYEPRILEIDTPHYLIADIDNGTILAASDLNIAAPIASLVKLMTAVVAAEEIDLDGRIRIASPTFVTSLIPRLSERSSVSMYSLLQLLLVESSNEAAETIAGEIGREEFISAMNAKARQLGMMDTNFADPSGLSSENVSSLGDLYRLTEYIRDNRGFIFEITKHAELTSAYVGGEFSGLVNFNEVKGMDSFSGGKVGETLAAGQTSISLHNLQFQGEQRTLVVIILGSNGRTDDIELLISHIQNQFGR